MDNYLIIKPPKGWFHVDIKELWEYRELAYFFAWREIKVRYKQTIIGILWAVFQPVMATIIFTVFFGRFAKMPSEGIPYPLFVYTGLIFWNYFSFGLTHSSESMIGNANIIQKIYFPRLIIPISSSLVGLIDFAVSGVLLVVLMFYYNYMQGFTNFLMVPVLLVLTFLASVGLGSFLGALNVKYRDVRYAVPFFIQMLIFLTPVIYPVSIIDAKYKWLLGLNPMSGIIEAARFFILGSNRLDLKVFSISCIMSLCFFVFGIIYFRKTERFFADII
ncbi:MAG: ABC transporter permease [Candidatus Brocadiaceae bacterium]|nr:ABC transporter permease [Candidatus Brocadiaceae bacterium]